MTDSFSSSFTYVGNNGVQYPNSILRDDNYGNLVIFNSSNGIVSELTTNLGYINYQTGQVQINNLLVSSYIGSYISIYLTLENTDISISQNQILLISPTDVSINVIAD